MWVSPSSIHERRSSPETAPTPALRMVLLLKSMNVGMLVMRKAEETSGFWSTSIFTNLTRPAYSGATSAKMGLMYLQGPHQVAQKSTSTGVSASSTSAMKLSSETGVTWLTALFVPLSVLLSICYLFSCVLWGIDDKRAHSIWSSTAAVSLHLCATRTGRGIPLIIQQLSSQQRVRARAPIPQPPSLREGGFLN